MLHVSECAGQCASVCGRGRRGFGVSRGRTVEGTVINLTVVEDGTTFTRREVLWPALSWKSLPHLFTPLPSTPTSPLPSDSAEELYGGQSMGLWGQGTEEPKGLR